MSSYYMGYHYERVKRGLGWRVEGGRLVFFNVTKKSAEKLVRELKKNGIKNANYRKEWF